MKPINSNEYLKNNSHVDTEALREDLYDYFNTLHYMLSDTEFDFISRFARDWLTNHLADPATFERSVREKALEVSTGDHLHDYYHALLLRRDQLLAARDVFREYTSTLRDIFSEDRNLVMQRLRAFDFDKGIYLRAMEYQRNRTAALDKIDASLSQELLEIEAEIDNQETAMEMGTADTVVKKKRATTKTTAKSKESSSESKPKRQARYFHKSI